jgi:hypothetical protein
LLFIFLLQKHQVNSSLPPLPEGGEVDERTVVADDSQGTSRPESEVAGSHKSAASSDKETESEASESIRSPPFTASPKNKRKRGDVEDSGISKPSGSPAKEASPEEEGAFNPYEDASLARKLPCHLFLFIYLFVNVLILSFVDSGEEEEEPAANVTAPTSTSQTLVLSEARRATKET